MAFWHKLFKPKPAPPQPAPAPAAAPKTPAGSPDPKQAHDHAAAGRVYPISQLLAAGMSIDHRDAQGRTMLDVAIAAGQTQTARMLMRKGAALYEKAHWQQERSRLRGAMETSPLPHLVNQQLAALEHGQSIAVVESFPEVLSLSMSNVCNAQCVFCGYAAPPPGGADFTSLEDIQRMTWLKYVSTLSLSGGTTDTLTNHQFPEILRWLAENHPHLRLNLITNGIGLNDAVIDAMAGRLYHINVSLNASDREEWERVSRSRGFDRIVEMLRGLRRLKDSRGAKKPVVALSMVLHTENRRQVPDFINLAADVGAEQVQLIDLVERMIEEQPERPNFQDLLSHPDLRQPVMEAAQKQADALGLKLWRNESFEGKDCKASRYRRGGFADCWDPWARCELMLNQSSFTRGKIGEVALCCYGVRLHVPFHLDRLDPRAFLAEVWNHPILQFYRKTVNRRGANCVCDSCGAFAIHHPHANQAMGLLSQVVSTAQPEAGFQSLSEVETAFVSINAQFQVALRDADISEAGAASPPGQSAE